MIVGRVQEREARIRLTILGPTGRRQIVDAVVDTGYTESLTLPESVIEALELRWRSLDVGSLADGSTCLFDVYDANVVWDRKRVKILVDSSECEPLVGMTLLRGYELNVQVEPNGTVSISKLSRSR
jgi:clan AA aspartic protease